jgi:hypothetical protein
VHHFHQISDVFCLPNHSAYAGLLWFSTHQICRTSGRVLLTKTPVISLVLIVCALLLFCPTHLFYYDYSHVHRGSVTPSLQQLLYCSH